MLFVQLLEKGSGPGLEALSNGSMCDYPFIARRIAAADQEWLTLVPIKEHYKNSAS